MTKMISGEELQLRKQARRRLVGAITLAIAAVVFLPMVLDGEPERKMHEIAIHIPSDDFPHELPLESDAKDTQSSGDPVQDEHAEIQAEDQRGSSSPPIPSKLQAETAEKAVPGAGSSGSAPVTNSAAPLQKGTFVVQLGAFSDIAKARQQAQTLSSRNTKAFTETVATEHGEITRVRVGPFDTREEAEDAREHLKKLGFTGVVVDR